MNYASPLRASLPASKLYYSHRLNPINSPLIALKAVVQQVSAKPLELDCYAHLTEALPGAGRMTEMRPYLKHTHVQERTHTAGVIHQ